MRIKPPIAIAAASKDEISSGDQIARMLVPLVGQSFKLTGKTRTDGTNIRKLVAHLLEISGNLPAPAADGVCQIIAPKKKGLPRLLREFADTCAVTSGTSYNLQVWNRNPSEPIPQIEYLDGSVLRASDVRFIFVRVDTSRSVIRSIVVATPDYIVRHFGKFGKQTVKEQLIILPRARERIISKNPPILFYPDSVSNSRRFCKRIVVQSARIHDLPKTESIISLHAIRDFVSSELIGTRIEPSATKTRGQQLEKIVAAGLGYKVSDEDVLRGGFPDIRHQALEVKIQDAATIDLGRYSPQAEEPVDCCPGFSTQSIRYLIALTEAATGICRGAVLCPGKRLAEHFVYVANQSFKCQRSIPMAFFDRFDFKVVFNPPYP